MVRAVVFLILAFAFSWKTPVVVFQTTAQLQANGAWLGKGAYVETMGKLDVGDNGGGLYKITTGTANGYDLLAITGSSLVAELQVKSRKVNAIAYGFKNDVLQVDSISLSTSGVVTVPTAVFSSSDVGKKIYIRDAFDMRPKYEAYAGFQGTVANFAALPGSPSNKDLYKVTNAADDTFRDTLTGTQYYYYYTTQGRWVWLDGQQALLAEITSYTSPTQINVDYSRPTDAANNRTGYYGTNNRSAWDSLSQFILTRNYQAHFPGNKDSGYLVNTEIDNAFDQLALTESYHCFGLLGDGPGATNIYLTHLPDTGVINADILDPVNNPAFNTFLNINAGTNKVEFEAKGITFIGVDDVGYRRNDSWPEWNFLLHAGPGQLTFESCEWFGGSNVGYFLNSTSEKMNATFKECYVDGGSNGMEILFNWYGDNEPDLLFLEHSIFKNIGQEQEWSFNAKNRGVVYVRPWKSHKAVGCTFENILDRWQNYDGGGSDIVHTFEGLEQSFEDCIFVANGKDVLYAFWGSRSAPLAEFTRCKFKGINGGNIFVGIEGRNTAKITDCQFGPGVSIPISTISNNNVWEEPAFIDIDRCIFFSGGIDIYPNSPPVAPLNISIRNSEFPIDSNYTVGQRIRFHSGGNTAIVLLENLTVKDSNTVTAPFIFFEGGASADITIEGGYYGINNGSDAMQLIKQLRGPSTLTINNAEAPDTITLNIGIDPYTGEAGPKLFGRDNKFSYSISNASGNPGQEFDCFQRGSHSGTTDLSGLITITLNKSCNFNWADVDIIGDNVFTADPISIDSSALVVRVKNDLGTDAASTAVNLYYEIDKTD